MTPSMWAEEEKLFKHKLRPS